MNQQLTRSLALDEARVPHALLTGASLISGLLVLFLVWAAFARVDEIASATGQVVPSGYIQEIQHPDGGIVREILVQDGDMVQKGQPLLKFDQTAADADLGQMRARQTALQQEANRLRAYAGQQAKDDGGMATDAKDILASMEDARAQQKSVLRDQIAQKEKELLAAASTRRALEKNVALKKQENDIYQSTLRSGSSSKVTALASERELNQLQGQLAEAQSQERRAADAVSESQSRLVSLDADLRETAMKSLGDVEGQLAEVNKSIAKQEGAASRTTLFSPVHGLVKGLAVHTLGAVVEPGKTLMEVVPLGEALIVEALVEPADVGNLKAGQSVKVKVSAFDSTRFGSIIGKLQSVSASTFQNNEGHSFYKARVTLDRNYVGEDPEHNVILPGMTVQAGIVTGDKTILQYLLRPIDNVLSDSFHER
ncbi:MAG: HlyD family type I secretion periplasmic adaptor subunit [Micavibrio sp.]|nr:HlyD family type I secretion periplasmic adaptor subunit [Micavibrio sp.]